MPRTLFGNSRSKSHDDSVKLPHRSNGINKLIKGSPVQSKSTTPSTTSKTKEIPPHRLKDNLHWRCSTCKSLVTTSETRAHLIGCVTDLVDLYTDSDSNSDCSLHVDPRMHSLVSVKSHSSDRPRTKKLERPTPNIRHPVIGDKTIETDNDDPSIGNVSDPYSFRKFNTGSIKSIPENPLETTKCNLNHRTLNKGLGSNNNNNANLSFNCWTGGGRVYPPPPPTVSSPVGSENTKKVCNSCDRSAAPERLHSHHSNKSSSSSNHSNCHHIHANNHPRVNMSPTKDKGSNTKVNDSKTSPNKSSQRALIKTNNKTNNSKSTGNNNVNNPVDSFSDGQPEQDKGDENGSNKSNVSVNLNCGETSDQNHNNNCLSLQMKCYLCRQEFKTDEIETHEIECLEKWKHNSTVLSPNQRVPVASTVGATSDRRNSLTSTVGCDPAGWEHFKSQLTPCPKCSRTFFPHRLAAHVKACLGPQAGKRSKNSSQTRNNDHPVVVKDKVQLNQHAKCTKKPLPDHQRVGQFNCNKQT